jgi:carbamoyltransferase
MPVDRSLNMPEAIPSKSNPLILGINASLHNGSVCLLRGNEIVAAVQEERLSGKKRTGLLAAENSLAIPYCLKAAGIEASMLDLVVVCTAGRTASDIRNDIGLNKQLRVRSNSLRCRIVPHHLAHAIGALALSGYKEAAILVVDGLGSPYSDLTDLERVAIVKQQADGWEYASLYEARNGRIICLEKHLTETPDWLVPNGSGMPLFRSFGAMYSAVAQQIFGSPLEAGKVMGLASYGKPIFDPGDFYRHDNGTFVFLDAVPNRYLHSDRWPKREREYMDLAASVQSALENAIGHLHSRLRSLSSCCNLCYSGGVALNCTTNEILHRAGLFQDIFIPPAADDSGVAVGAAFYGLWMLTDSNTRCRMVDDSTGICYSTGEVQHAVDSYPRILNSSILGQACLCEQLAARLSNGEVAGWFHGRSELGPRALGHRSILADPRSPSMKDKVNDDVKGRELFRPLAPAVLEEKANEWFHIIPPDKSPFMLRTWQARTERQSAIPAVLHIDNTSRVQTVSFSTQPLFYELIRSFETQTNVPILLNTSFNGPGEPIVETPLDALWAFLGLGLDCLMLEDRLIDLSEKQLCLLDLIPVVSAKSIIQEIPVTNGCLPGPSTGIGFFVYVSKPWGTHRQYISGLASEMLMLVNGSRTGWQILKWLSDAQTQGVNQLRVIRELHALRRLGALTFKEGLHSVRGMTALAAKSVSAESIVGSQGPTSALVERQ